MAHQSTESSLMSPKQSFQPAEPQILGTRSPRSYLASQKGSRVASPSVNGQFQAFGQAAPSASHTGISNVGLVSNDASPDLLSRMREQQTLLQVLQLQQQQQHYHQQQILHQSSLPYLSIPRSEERKMQPVAHHNQAEIVTPVPRGYCLNPSQNLQRGVDEAEAHLSHFLDEIGGRERSETIQNDEEYDEDQTRNTSKNVGRAAPQNGGADGFVLDVSPNIKGISDHETNHHGQSQGRYSPKVSQLNVNAPKFEPRISKGPGVFSFSSRQQAEEVIETDYPSFLHSYGPTQDSNRPPQPSKWNVTAPAFMPKPSVTATIPSREFSFSALRPSLRPDAPAFKPNDAGSASDDELTGEQNVIQPVRIFGDIKFSEVIKPPKSKAVPITRPDKSTESKEICDADMDGQEDESGRITQADGRQKRMRYVDSEASLQF